MKNKRVIKRPENVRVEGTGRLFTVQRAISELHRVSEENQVTHEGNVEDVIVVPQSAIQEGSFVYTVMRKIVLSLKR